jgi:hypothetical protein
MKAEFTNFVFDQSLIQALDHDATEGWQKSRSLDAGACSYILELGMQTIFDAATTTTGSEKITEVAGLNQQSHSGQVKVSGLANYHNDTAT